MKLKELIISILTNIPTFYVRVDKNILTRCKWINKLWHFYIFFIKIYRSSDYPYFPQYCFKKYVDYIKYNIAKGVITKEYIINLWLDYFYSVSDDEKYFMTKLFFESGFLDNNICKIIIDYCKKTLNISHRYYTINEISMQTFKYANGFYADFYNDRKEILKIVAQETCQKIKQKNKNRGKKIVCIVTYMLGPDLSNSVQRVASMIANNISCNYDQVYVVSGENFYIGNEEKLFNYLCFRKRSSLQYVNEIHKLFNENVEVFIPDANEFQKRNQQVLDFIYDISPEVIIDMSDEMSSLSYYYSQDFPTYYIPLRSNASSIFFTYILGARWKYEEGNKIFNSIDSDKIIEWMFPEYVPPKNRNFTKQDIGVAKDCFVIISIGNNGLYSDSFCDLMANTLLEYPKFIWLFVGTEPSDYLKNEYNSLIKQRRIIIWGREKELSGLCAACDVHLRSFSTGGSGATAIACQNGLPVVMPDFVCDPMRWLGRDFSKLHTEDDIIKEIIKLYEDKFYYQQQKDRVLNLVKKASDSEFWWGKFCKIIRGNNGAKSEN